ncbi:MAG: beta-propeller fold lactonase family protein [Leptospiraceae bacterium]|nr:beta-propeller fold lactonase family protein [Leptospiraceae bacterium]
MISQSYGNDGDDSSALALLLSEAALSSSTTTVLKYGYVTLDSDAAIGMYTIDDDTGIWTAMTPASVSTGGGTPRDLVKHPTASFLYSADQSGNSISMFQVASDGQLTALSPATVTTSGSAPIAITMDAAGLFGYVGFNSTSSIESYSVDQITGQWNYVSALTGCGSARQLVVHPNGNFLYALCSGSSQIRRHSITNGVLTFLGTDSSGGGQPNGLTLAADGKYLYVTSQTNNVVSMYGVDSATGDLTALSPFSTATDGWANEVVVDPTGQFAFVNCWQSGAKTVRMYKVGSDGVLTDNSPNSVATGGSSPLNLYMEPTGRYLYVANSGSNNVNMYSMDSSTGLLTSNGLVSTGNGPRGIAVVTEDVILGQ